MNMEQIIDAVHALPGSLVLAPGPGSEFPEVAWGDSFFYYAPDGRVPTNTQPYATIVTKDYPDDSASHLDQAGRWRLNVHVGRSRFTELTGETPGDLTRDRDFSAPDVVLPHPVYSSLGWIAIVNPADATGALALDLVRAAHEAAAARRRRRRRRLTTPGPHRSRTGTG
ncbi:DUF6194 family protein [Occultella gossypii]|uniref:DUF6194 domain-containing protein n=1 Tax=Occultella gossypii TaxID=2800820 RepID=A0ABS7S3K1_9MICO|nr:DUF6194 family protein [Occultella gossypii]MBZ2194929.1 hypothetical protein [Occultella gossypii]